LGSSFSTKPLFSLSHAGLLSPKREKIWLAVGTSMSLSCLLPLPVWERSDLSKSATVWLANLSKLARLSRVICTIRFWCHLRFVCSHLYWSRGLRRWSHWLRRVVLRVVVLLVLFSLNLNIIQLDNTINVLLNIWMGNNPTTG
jgi:hypothetical protein